ncbi:XrtA system polysaccharide chain length determinant [Pleionea mediterranea]|jgi:polysaccharide chain length determinant protein (PEP-CTERM system associated)|uniref:Polysaccharide chain length determinant protein (PEP-CTERM system associated) n=1 Tax=Pleionea mediterranea TaxID=523701 RepID=A0A316FZ78_9GAMM|nr:XrtA system polysaccharide chain length determinant [Pleionea mediterranea]PWK53723.1 polysaccharide chain length determinant protein (PEP-CTERM system associated) [Pleionea mediterranea]
MNPETLSIVRIIQKEVWIRRRLVIAIYVTTSLLFLAAAWFWPKVYTSSSSVLVDQQNILRPLMEGTAETTRVESRAAMAKKIIFSQRTIRKLLESETWQHLVDGEITSEDIESMGQRLSSATSIKNTGENIIEIAYTNKDPIKAYQTTQLMTDIFIEDSITTKRKESRDAFDFIDTQAKSYQEKLKQAESAIKEFRSKNIDASSTAKQNATERLIELKRELETVELDLSTAESSLSNYQSQLAGKASFTDQASIARENQLNERIAALESRLAELKLNYHDTYPDIIQLKGQIADLQKQVDLEVQRRNAEQSTSSVSKPTGETAQFIRSQISTVENTVASLKARQRQLLSLMDNERQTLDKISSVEAEIAELTRDYEVNQRYYQNLLNQRENARISMNIDLQNQGLTLKVQEPASVPVTPKGLHFSHIILAGLVLSLAIPIAIIYGLTLLDQKVRTELTIQKVFDIPVLANVSTLKTIKDKSLLTAKITTMAISLIAVWSIYAAAIYLRTQG